jgi:hypothetical protein
MWSQANNVDIKLSYQEKIGGINDVETESDKSTKAATNITGIRPLLKGLHLKPQRQQSDNTSLCPIGSKIDPIA